MTTPTPKRQREGLPLQLAELDIGESVARCRSVELATIATANVPLVRRNLDLTVRKAVERAIERTGFRYTVNGGEFRADDKLMVVVTVTRTA